MPKLLRELGKDYLEELYITQKLSIRQIATKERISGSGILTLLRKYNIPTRSIAVSMTGRKHSPETRQKMRLKKSWRKES